ncbi:MAG: gliding motility-associated C-terminal domain-containing protein [bacterium]|nr:gliding motility-associated C-terminal domain-containing protein [bacterium]
MLKEKGLVFSRVDGVLPLLFVSIFLLLVSFTSLSQTYTFATLNGSPTMNTTGWNLTGNAMIGDTPGDANVDYDELVLTTNFGTFQSGAIFWNTPIDLQVCTKWTVEFDFRIFGGSGADGLAFCFLDVPPTGFVAGGGAGIPGTANGLKVILDTYDNCGGPNPELQIYSGIGYDECSAGITKLENSLGNLGFVRSNNYQPAKITYDGGNVELFINNTLYLSAYAPANFAGYMGFTASTGGFNDLHSIKNVVIYTEQAVSDAGPDVIICDGQSVQVGATSNSQYVYNWTLGTGLNSTTISDPTFTLGNSGNTPITQTLVVETSLTANPGVCPTTDTVEITIAPNVQETINETVCGNSYTWNGVNYQSSGTYTDQFQTIYGCDSTVTLNLTLQSNPTISATNDTICEGDQATVTASGASSYVWSSVPQGTSASVTVSPTATTTYEVIGTDVNGCMDTAYTTVVVNPAPVVNISAQPDSICIGDSSIITVTGAQSYNWISGNVSNPTGTSNTVFPIQSTNFSVEGTGANGCAALAQLAITVNDLPQLAVTGLSASICEGDSLQLNASGASSYEWVGPVLNSANANPQLISPNQLTDYQLVGSSNGCSDTLHFSVDVNPAPTLSMILPDAFCAGEEDTVYVFGATSYSWSPVVQEISPGVAIVDPVSSTTYAVTGTDGLGCSASISGTVGVLALPFANFIASDQELDLFLSTQVFFSNQSENSSSYQWYFGDGTSSVEINPIHEYSNFSTGDYQVELVAFNDLGCSDTTSQWIRVTEGIVFFVPNSFTPNADEFNALFMASFAGDFDEHNYKLEVFNRWGQIVFESKDVYEGWDGTFNNLPVPDGTYTWSIQYKRKNSDERQLLYGHVNVLR